MITAPTIRLSLLAALLAPALAPPARGQSELPNVLPYSWSFVNFSTNPCVPPGTHYTWDRYRETFIGIPPNHDAASGFDKLFFRKSYEKLGATGNCFGMSLMAIQIAQKGGHLGFCGPIGHYSGDNIGAPALDNDGCDETGDVKQGPTSLELRRAIEETHGHQSNLASLRRTVEVLSKKDTDGLSAYQSVQDHAPCVLVMIRDHSELTGAGHAVVAYAAREVDGQKRIYIYDPNRTVALQNTSDHPEGFLLDQVEWYIKGDNYVEVGGDGAWSFRSSGWNRELDENGDWVIGDDGFGIVHEDRWPQNGPGIIYAMPMSVIGPRDRNPLSLGMSVSSLMSTIFLIGADATLKQVSAPGGKIAFVPGTKNLEFSPAKCLLEVFPLLSSDGLESSSNDGERYILLAEIDGARDIEVQCGRSGYSFELAQPGGSLVVTARTSAGGTDLLRIADHASREPKLMLFNRAGVAAYDVELTQVVEAGKSSRSIRLESLEITHGGLADIRLSRDGAGLAITSPSRDTRFNLVLKTEAGDRVREARVQGIAVAAGATALIQPEDWSNLRPDAILGGSRALAPTELVGYQAQLVSRPPAGPIGPDFGAAIDLAVAGGTSDTGRTSHDARTGVYTQVSRGAGIGAAGDALHFAYAPVRGDFELVVEITTRTDPATAGDPPALRGLLVRQDLSTASRSSWLALDTAPGVKPEPRWLHRGAHGEADAVEDRHRFPSAGAEIKHLKLVRRGTTLYGFVSADGGAWVPAGSSTWHGLSARDDVLVGFASATGAGRIALSTGFRVRSFGPIDPALEPLLPSEAVATGTVIHEQRFSGANGSLPADITAHATPESALPAIASGRLRLTPAGPGAGAATAFSRFAIDDIDGAVHQLDFDVFFTAGRGEEPAGGIALTLLAVDGDLGAFAPAPGAGGAALGLEVLGGEADGAREALRGAISVELDLRDDGSEYEGALEVIEGEVLHAGIDSQDQAASVAAAPLSGIDPFAASGLHATVIYNRGEVAVFVHPIGEERAAEPVARARLLPLGFQSERARVFVGFSAATDGGSQAAAVDNLVVSVLDCGDAPEEAVIAGAPAGPVGKGGIVTLDGSGSRPGSGNERRRMSHHWQVIAGEAEIAGPDWGPTVNVRPVGDGVVTVRLTVDDGECDNAGAAEATFVVDGSIAVFRRGDADASGAVQITDAVRVLNYLFLGHAAPPCLDAADADDNGQVQLTDAVRVLGYLFLGTGSIPAPTPDGPCGPDPAGSPSLGCEAYEACR